MWTNEDLCLGKTFPWRPPRILSRLQQTTLGPSIRRRYKNLSYEFRRISRYSRGRKWRRDVCWWAAAADDQNGAHFVAHHLQITEANMGIHRCKLDWNLVQSRLSSLEGLDLLLEGFSGCLWPVYGLSICPSISHSITILYWDQEISYYRCPTTRPWPAVYPVRNHWQTFRWRNS